jgi:ATP-binding cassette subfamily B protein RaxB
MAAAAGLIAAAATLAAVLSLGAAPDSEGIRVAGQNGIVVRQVTESDCGLAAVATLARATGVDLPAYRALLAKYPPPSGGLSVAGIVAIGAELGLPLDAVRVAAGGLATVPLPALVHLRAGHFVVLTARGPSQWTVADPAQGMRAVAPVIFSGSASGAVLLLRQKSEVQ